MKTFANACIWKCYLQESTHGISSPDIALDTLVHYAKNYPDVARSVSIDLFSHFISNCDDIAACTSFNKGLECQYRELVYIFSPAKKMLLPVT